MKIVFTLAAALFLISALAIMSLAGPVTAPEGARQAQVLNQLTKSLAKETKAAAKFDLIAKAMKGEHNVDVRRRMLETAMKISGPDLETFLTNLVTSDEDSRLRSEVATTLGRTGSERCLTTLADVARNDRKTSYLIGCIGGQGTARREATFAIAELVARFPKLADDAAAKLGSLPVVDDVKDNESLADARIQALYQITRDKSLLKPFYERLKSKGATNRAHGVVAFRFLKLEQAPVEIVNALKDTSTDVRSWSALVLGEIGDPKTAEALMTAAGDAKEDRSVRCNAIGSLGYMKAAAAANLMEKLLADPELQTQAAIALYRITGKKVKQFPEGYNAD